MINPSDKKSSASLRIFLSYGHDSSEELVRLIKTDLEQRGHDVWFDKSDIKAGDDWRRAITDGITASNRVLSFLSKHSTRDPGVCLDEIAIAIGVKGGNIQTILVESETDVNAPVSVSHIQWLDMHDWKERRAAGEAEWAAWYDSKFSEIIRVVESDESRRFAGEIETLNRHLQPISSDSRISALLRKGFVGRTWLFESIERWRTAAERSSRLFWIMGEPGVGKSAAVAHLAHFGRDKVIAAQFVEWDKPDHRDPHRVIRNLAFQLATRLPDYRKLLLALPEIGALDKKRPPELFDYLLLGPLKLVIRGGRQRYLIVIDALDEAGDATRNPLVETLARHAPQLPEWIGLVVTSRPESVVKTPLQGLNPFLLDTAIEENRADLIDYIRHQLAPELEQRADADDLINGILEKSEGVFLYAETFCDAVRNNHLSLDRPMEFPRGLGGIYFQFFQRQFPSEDQFASTIEPLLGAILAAREPLPIEILQKLFRWTERDLFKWVRTLGSMFPVVTDYPAPVLPAQKLGQPAVLSVDAAPTVTVIKPYHKSLADWLTDEARAGTFFVSVTDGHRRLADHRLAELTSQSGADESIAVSIYWARRLLHHAYAPRDWRKVVACIEDQRVFQSLWPGSYDCMPLLSSYDPSPLQSHATRALGFYRGNFSLAATDALTPAVLDSTADATCVEVCWALAHAFADRTREQQLKLFAYGKKLGVESNKVRNVLNEQDPLMWLEYRDVMYSFVALAEIAPRYARATCGRDARFEANAKSFLAKHDAPISSYLSYLEDFARTEGWSGQLEDEASGPRRAWTQLEDVAYAKNR